MLGTLGAIGKCWTCLRLDRNEAKGVSVGGFWCPEMDGVRKMINISSRLICHCKLG